MRQLAILALFAMTLAAQSVSAVAYTKVISPTDADLAALSPAPSFAPIAIVFVVITNAVPGTKYTFVATAQGQGQNSYTASGSTNGVSNQAYVIFSLQPGDSLTAAPRATVTGTFAATSTLVTN